MTEKFTIFRESDRRDSQRGQRRLSVTEVCRKHNINSPTYYKWKAKYGGLGVSELKRMYADLALENRAMKDAIEKKL